MTDPVLVLVLLGAVLAVDATSVGQFMMSRPLPSAIMAGLVLGDPMSGLMVGGFMEVFHLPRLPLGGSRIPEGGPSAVAATYAATLAPGASGIVLAVVVGLLLGEIGGMTWGPRRRLNALVLGSARGNGGRLGLRHGACVVLDFGRGLVLTSAGLGLAGMVAVLDPESSGRTPGQVLAPLVVAAAIPLGALLRTVEPARALRVVFGTGLLLGLALGAWA